jgi:thioredoxin 1
MSTVLTTKNYTKIVEKSELPVLFDAWAPWCQPCKVLEPILNELEKSYDGKLVVVKLNVDEEPELAQRLGVQGLPTVRLIKNGEVKFETAGMPEKSKIVAAVMKAMK